MTTTINHEPWCVGHWADTDEEVCNSEYLGFGRYTDANEAKPELREGSVWVNRRNEDEPQIWVQAATPPRADGSTERFQVFTPDQVLTLLAAIDLDHTWDFHQALRRAAAMTGTEAS